MKRIVGWILLFLGLVCTPALVKADHITGGEMYYAYAGRQGDLYVYRATLRLLMRCNSGRQFPNPIIIGVFSKATNERIRDISVPLGSQSPISLNTNDPCISNPPIVCYEVATYQFDVIVPQSTEGYIIAAQVNFRVNGLANLLQGGNIGATYTAEIPGSISNVSSISNNSVQFTGSDLVVVCANSPFTYSFAASDPDRDSLRYYFCAAYQTGTSGGGMNQSPPISPPYGSVPYGPGFGAGAPLGSRVAVDPYTGMVSGIAPDIGQYVITVCVDEIRNGQVVGTQRKDIQLNITGCSVAAAILDSSYQLCNESLELNFENRSVSPLIQTYSWKLLNSQGNTIATSSTPRFSYIFSDTGLYKISLATNVGLSCPDTDTSQVFVYPGMNASFSFSGLCFGSPTRFTDNSTLRYGSVASQTWDFGEPSNAQNMAQNANATITYIAAGQKNVFHRVVNTNGCVDTAIRFLDISAEPPIEVSLRDTLICPPDTLELKVKGDGQFTWDAAPGLLTGANTSTLRVAPLATTWYRVTQRLDNCVGSDSIRVRVANFVNLTLMADTTICLGDEIELRAGGNAITYEWSPLQNLSDPGSEITKARPAATTLYTVTGGVSKCVATASVLVNTVPYPLANAGNDLSICFGATVQLSATVGSNQMLWSPASHINNRTIPNPVVSPETSTYYILQVFENRGCPKPGIDSVFVEVEPPILLDVVRDTSVVVGQPLVLNATGAPRYLWIPGDGLDNANIGSPTATFTRPSEGHIYTVTGFNNAGCSESLMVHIKVFANGPAIFVPTAFTPNSDGLNETLKPTLAGMQRMNYFRVFNRYGQMIFSTSSLKDSWNGMVKGILQPSGTYVWVVQALDYTGATVISKGTTILIR